jgi:diadenosine tetraphosphate (Ap4A) HIT family hydrolase
MIKDFVNQQNARPGDNYQKVIEEIAEHKVCPFCNENLKKYHKNPILIEGKYWLATNNLYPYKNTLHHVIFINKEHIEHIEEVQAESWYELHSQIKQIAKERKIKGGSFLLRFGDTNFTGGSVSHLHAHLIQSNPEDETYDKNIGLMTRIG